MSDPVDGVDKRAVVHPHIGSRGFSVDWIDRRVFYWAAYDVGSSAYFSVVSPVLFPVFFLSAVAIGDARFLYLGATASTALVIAGFLAPIIGGWADRKGYHLRLLAGFTAICCAATASMALAGPGDIGRALVAFGIAEAAYLLGASLYESYLPHITTVRNTARVSSFGWAVGFLGGIAAIIAVFPFARGGPNPEQLDAYRVSFLIVAAMFLVIGWSAIIGLRRRANRPAGGQSRKTGILKTLRDWREHREAFKIMCASYLLNTAIFTIAIFVAEFIRANFANTVEDLLMLLLIYHFISAPSTMIIGIIADYWSHRNVMAVSVATWVVTIMLLIFGGGAWVPLMVVVLLAVVNGATQAILRSMLAQAVPRARAAEFFGFNTFAGTLSAAIGPLLYGYLASSTGDERIALASLLVFVLAGGVVLATTKPLANRGR